MPFPVPIPTSIPSKQQESENACLSRSSIDAKISFDEEDSKGKHVDVVE